MFLTVKPGTKPRKFVACGHVINLRGCVLGFTVRNTRKFQTGLVSSFLHEVRPSSPHGEPTGGRVRERTVVVLLARCVLQTPWHTTQTDKTNKPPGTVPGMRSSVDYITASWGVGEVKLALTAPASTAWRKTRARRARARCRPARASSPQPAEGETKRPLKSRVLRVRVQFQKCRRLWPQVQF